MGLESEAALLKPSTHGRKSKFPLIASFTADKAPGIFHRTLGPASVAARLPVCYPNIRGSIG